jgi:hypothetical protein
MGRTMIQLAALALLASAGGAGAAGKQSIARQGELILFEHPDYAGDDYTTTQSQPLIETDWNVGSIAVYPGEKWQICNKPRYGGDCITVTENVPNAAAIGIMGKVPSARRVVAPK